MNANVTADDAVIDAPGASGRFNFRSERLLWGLAAIGLSALIAIACFRGIPQLISLETTINDQNASDSVRTLPPLVFGVNKKCCIVTRKDPKIDFPGCQ